MTHNNTELSIKPTSYVVTVDDLVYRYALHSKNHNRIIFPSQVLNVLEYCLFKKVKDGWKGPLTRDTFNFNVDFFIDKELVEEWPDKEDFENDMMAALEHYLKNLTEQK